MSSKLDGKIRRIDLRASKDSQNKLLWKHQSTFDRLCFVEAQIRHTDKWYKARILDSRLSKDYEASRPKDDSSYDYYVHYEAFDRRLDDWVSFGMIRKTKEKIGEQAHQDSAHAHLHPNDNPHHKMNHNEVLSHHESTKFKTVPRIQLGRNISEAWYYSPFPIYYHNIDCLFICDFCLSFFAFKSELRRHSERCPLSHPPGDEIYRDEEMKVAMFEVDGLKNQVYCENLAFLSKLFLDHKNLAGDMTIFLFYVLCEIENGEYHIAGYFSKVVPRMHIEEKESENNLSCILVFPFYQRKGYGKFLITFSYELSLIEDKIGGPEKPLSDMGRKAYLSWWTQRIIDYIRKRGTDPYNLDDISKETGIVPEDIKWTLEKCKIIKIANGEPYLCTDDKFLNEVYKMAGQVGLRVLRDNIHWVPFKLRWGEYATNFL